MQRPARVVACAIVAIALAGATTSAQSHTGRTGIDIAPVFEAAAAQSRIGKARKTKAVDARPATPGEVVVTTIAGEGAETKSAPAETGDMVVRNRCPETGNEQILVKGAKFGERYEGPTGPAAADGWSPYRPRGIEMGYFVVEEAAGEFLLKAPWGEVMIARPGDAIVRDPNNHADTYRIARAAFACTYDIVVPAAR